VNLSGLDQQIIFSSIVRDALSDAMFHLGDSFGRLTDLFERLNFGSIAVTGVGGSRPLAICIAEMIRRLAGRFCCFVPPLDLVNKSYPDLLIIVSASGQNTSLNRIAEQALCAGKLIALLSLDAQSEAASIVRDNNGILICPSKTLVVDEFVAIVNSIRMLALFLSSIGQAEIEKTLCSCTGESLLPSTTSRSIWQTTSQGCVVIYSADLRSCAADIEMRMRETGVSPFHAYDQFELVHGGYVQVHALIERHASIFLVASSRYLEFFEMVYTSLRSVTHEVQLVAFGPDPLIPALQGLMWSICDYATYGRSQPKQLPTWGRNLWERWR
jgi:D-arabinose 5-phosphate isomerase GutQ